MMRSLKMELLRRFRMLFPLRFSLQSKNSKSTTSIMPTTEVGALHVLQAGDPTPSTDNDFRTAARSHFSAPTMPTPEMSRTLTA